MDTDNRCTEGGAARPVMRGEGADWAWKLQPAARCCVELTTARKKRCDSYIVAGEDIGTRAAHIDHASSEGSSAACIFHIDRAISSDHRENA
jgi:hypothetical protein